MGIEAKDRIDRLVLVFYFITFFKTKNGDKKEDFIYVFANVIEFEGTNYQFSIP